MANTWTTKAPTGLQVERNGNEFTFSWKIRDVDYGRKQEFEFKTSRNGSWHKRVITTKQTSITVELQAENISELSFHVRGWRKKFTKKVTGSDGKSKQEEVDTVKSAWSTKLACWVPQMPTMPTITYERLTANSGKFTVEHDADTDGKKIAKYVVYESCTSTSNANPPKDGKNGWPGGETSGLVNVSVEQTYTEQTETIQKTGLVRWFRARCIGPAGYSDWVYAHHAYSKPVAPALKSASAKAFPTRGSINLAANWTTQASLLRPVDEEIMQYVIAVPTDDACTAPATGWQDAISVTPSGKKDIVTATVSDSVGNEQCLWMRVVAKHDDDYVSNSKTMRVLTSSLLAPGINANPNFTTGAVSVTLTINTQCSVARHAIFYRDPKNPKNESVVAILAPGVTTTTVTINAIKGASKSCIGAYAFVGTFSGLSPKPIMASPKAVDEDIAPVAPSTPTLTQGTDSGSVAVGLSWNWTGATSMELTWADNRYAWESNESPKSCTISEIGAKTWYIRGLEVGKVWYFRARYHGLIDSDEATSAWSGMASIDLATTPETPTLTLNSGFVLPGRSISASWDYVNEDDSPQDAAQVCICNVSGSTITYGAVIANAGSGQNILVNYRWVRGTDYNLAVRVRSASGRYSAWSEPVSIYCPNLPTLVFASIQTTPIVNGVMTSLDGEVGLSMYADRCGGEYAMYITRATDCHIDRPDESVRDGYAGETIWNVSGRYDGSAQTYSYAITRDDLIGELDDGCLYTLIGTLTDDYGQTVTRRLPFRVNWTHKAAIAKPTAWADQRLMAMRITPTKPTGWVQGDVFDIYRITADQPELIVRDGEYGTTYVDPYPAFGSVCGHRVVAKTATGSYITTDNEIAWYDMDLDDGDIIESDALVIDANGMQITLPYNIELSNKWQKDFKRTAYLGGSVQGDWNPAILRDLTAKTVIVKNQDTGELLDMRDLAAYAGPAHIRTPDGSSFSCDIQVSENASYNDKKVQYSLTVKGIDPAEPDGMTLAEWLELHPVG